MLERTRTGLKEMPSNAAWLLTRALKPAEAIGSAAGSAAGARDQGRKVGAAVLDAAPVGPDAVELRVRRAQDAAERARRPRIAPSTPRANRRRAPTTFARWRSVVEPASRRWSAKQLACKQRVAEAQKTADAYVKHQRQAAEADGEERVHEVRTRSTASSRRRSGMRSSLGSVPRSSSRTRRGAGGGQATGRRGRRGGTLSRRKPIARRRSSPMGGAANDGRRSAGRSDRATPRGPG